MRHLRSHGAFRPTSPLIPSSARAPLAALLALVASAALAPKAASAQSATLSNLTTVTPVPTAGALGGTFVQTSTTTFYGQQARAGGGFDVVNGTLIASVYSGGIVQSLSGPGGTQTFGGTSASGQELLDFYYQIRLDSPNAPPTFLPNNSPVNQITISSFANFATAVGQNNTGPNASFSSGGISTNSATRSSLAAVAFNFDTPQVATAGFSTVLVVRTNATGFQAVGVASVGGTVSANTSTLAPLAASNAAPEPGTTALLAAGLLPVVGAAIRRRKV